MAVLAGQSFGLTPLKPANPRQTPLNEPHLLHNQVVSHIALIATPVLLIWQAAVAAPEGTGPVPALRQTPAGDRASTTQATAAAAAGNAVGGSRARLSAARGCRHDRYYYARLHDAWVVEG